MQKPQIHWKYQTPSCSSIKLGWKNLSQNGKLWLVLANLLWLSLVLYNYSTRGSELMLVSGPSPPLLFTIFLLQAKGFPKESVGSLMEVLKLENNRIFIADYPLPDTVRKVVIGRMDIQGPAFLQLAWNQGHQWIFQLDELQQVRHFFVSMHPRLKSFTNKHQPGLQQLLAKGIKAENLLYRHVKIVRQLQSNQH